MTGDFIVVIIVILILLNASLLYEVIIYRTENKNLKIKNKEMDYTITRYRYYNGELVNIVEQIKKKKERI